MSEVIDLLVVTMSHYRALLKHLIASPAKKVISENLKQA